ncbi:restriction endonuclease subunit S [Phaeobacter italicus]|uniref:restriction endonuclease subunit S n=1 Tax=Phaeobacter italicus TaxID=481446 RepID=UPI001CD5B5AB|nr:restriction endonuclease subunit S [Phaeobacter italicus]MCA0857284.1 restriction endonuclease subunit S [Phaeobacter italicus]
MSVSQLCPLGEIAEFFSGFAWKAGRFSDTPLGMPIIRIQNVGADASRDFKYWPDNYADRFVITKGDLLLTLSGSFRTAIWPGPDALLNQRIVKVSPKSNTDSRWLFYALEEAMVRIAGMGRHALVSNVALSDLKELKIDVPPLEEQRRIAGILDQAAELCRLRTRALDKLNTLGQAIFHEMFGSHCDQLNARKGTLGDFADFFSGNTLPDGEEFADQANGYLILKVSDLNREGNTDAVTMAASWSRKTGTRASTCPAGALVFPKRGGAIGTNKKRLLDRPAILDPNLMGVAPKQSFMTSDFLEGWFSCFDLSGIASGSSVPQLNKKDLDPLPVVLPSFENQLVYSKRRSTLKEMQARARVAQDTANALFASLQHRAFRGEL